MAKNKAGLIYILTNPSFPEYVKLGYTNDIDRRLRELNRSASVPYAFRIYATYTVSSDLSDKKLHAIIDTLNPDLRAIETVNGKTRTKEFYAMSAEDAYTLLNAIAEINGLQKNLKKYKPTGEEIKAEKQAKEIEQADKDKKAPFKFSMCGIKPGETVYYCDGGKNIPCTVVDDKKIEYDGQIMTLTGMAKLMLGKKRGIAGPKHFKYKNEWLNDIREKMEKK